METIFDYNQIKQIIPHRQPFLLIDRVVEYEEETLRGFKASFW